MARPARPMTLTLPAAAPLPAAEELFELGSLSYDDAAEFCGISRSEINKAVQRGELKPFHHGTKPLIPKRALMRWQAAKYAKEHPEASAGDRTA